MKRKVVKQGHATLMVSLPSKWAKKFNVTKGAEVEVSERENNLIISGEAKGTASTKKATIDVSSWNPLVNRLLLSYFLKGYDEIEVTYAESSQVKRFQKEVVVNELLGWEIVRQSKNSFLLKDLSGSELGNFDDVFNRLFFMIDALCGDLISSLERKEEANLIEADKAVNRLAYYCLRLLNKKGYRDFEKTSQIYSIVTLLEETADLFKDLSKATFNVMKSDITCLKELKGSLNLIKETFFKFDREKELSLATNYEKIKKMINKKSAINSYLHGINGNIIRMNNELLVINA